MCQPVADGDVSVIPQAWKKATPRAVRRAISGRGAAAPPQRTLRSDDRSISPASQAATIGMSTVGTPVATVTPSASISAPSAAGPVSRPGSTSFAGASAHV